MTPPGRSVLALVLALAGVSHYVMLRLVLAAGLTPPFGVAWRIGALAVIFIAIFIAQQSVITLNTRAARLFYGLCVAAYAAVVVVISRSPALGLGAAMMLFMVPGELGVRYLGYKSAWTAVLAVAVVPVAWSLAHPVNGWGWTLAPVLAFCAFSTFMAVQGPLKMRKLRRDGWGIALGQAAPEVRLPRMGEQAEWSLADERGRYVLLCFLRGHWCAVCHIMMRIYKAEAPRLLEHGVKLVAITPDGGPEAMAFAEQIGVDYTVLVDADCRVAQQFGALEAQAMKGKDAPLPASFLIDRQGTLRYASKPRDVGSFLDPREVIRVLAADAAPAAAAS